MRINATAFAGTLAMAAALLVAGCDKQRCQPASGVASIPDQLADLRKAAENSIRVSASHPDFVRFRGVRVWPQAIRNQFAICGQASVFGSGSATYVLFVAVVTRDDGGQAPAHKFTVNARVGSTVTEATRIYVDTLARCYEGGGPQNLRREAAVSVPPMPDDIKAVLAGPAQVAPPVPAAAAPAAQPQASARRQPAPTSSPAFGTIVMRQPGNIRIAPQGEILRVEPRGRELRVFGEAPGGWLQIGDTEANGWVHSSMVQRR